MSSELTMAELQAKIAKHAWEDPAFEAEFMADPKATFEKYTAKTLPSGLSIHAHYNTPTELHFVIAKRAESADGELNDDDLERVAGGEVVSVTVAISLVTVAIATVTANEGW